MITTWDFHTNPFPHQLEEWYEHRETEARGIFWDMGVGKTKLILDTMVWLFLEGKIDGVLVLAPNGVHSNWTIDEIPKHVSSDILLLSHAYSSKSANTKWHKQKCTDLIKHEGLSLLAMNYEAFTRSKIARKVGEQFLKTRKTLFVLDESARIKTPGRKRTKTIIRAGQGYLCFCGRFAYWNTPCPKCGKELSGGVKFKRILTGTPISNKPFDIYSQLRFLDGKFWKEHGFSSFQAFKTSFGIFETGTNYHTGRTYPIELGFKNLDHLKEIVDSISTRVTKEEVLDLPPKVYTKRYYDLSSEQIKLYTDIRDEFETELESGEVISAPMILVRLLRLQQVLCGYLPSAEGETIHDLDKNTRLTLLLHTIQDIVDAGDRAIIWARFTRDIDIICKELGNNAVRYDGKVSDQDRLVAKNTFQSGKVDFFVANPAAAGEGLTLHAANTVIYYSNNFNLTHRLQSEDRAHRIGQESTVRYIDLVARFPNGEKTIDTHIVRSLRDKQNIASKITGDAVREWL